MLPGHMHGASMSSRCPPRKGDAPRFISRSAFEVMHTIDWVRQFFRQQLSGLEVEARRLRLGAEGSTQHLVSYLVDQTVRRAVLDASTHTPEPGEPMSSPLPPARAVKTKVRAICHSVRVGRIDVGMNHSMRPTPGGRQRSEAAEVRVAAAPDINAPRPAAGRAPHRPRAPPSPPRLPRPRRGTRGCRRSPSAGLPRRKPERTRRGRGREP